MRSLVNHENENSHKEHYYRSYEKIRPIILAHVFILVRIHRPGIQLLKPVVITIQKVRIHRK